MRCDAVKRAEGVHCDVDVLAGDRLKRGFERPGDNAGSVKLVGQRRKARLNPADQHQGALTIVQRSSDSPPGSSHCTQNGKGVTHLDLFMSL